MTQQRAFIFDMDGTIVDNMGFHTRSWLEFFSRRGHAVDEAAFFAATAGRTGHEIIGQFLGEGLAHDDVTALIDEKEVLYREIYAPHLRAVEGFGALVSAAQAAGIRLAVGTAAPPSNVDFTLTASACASCSTPSSAPPTSNAASRNRTCSCWPPNAAAPIRRTASCSRTRLWAWKQHAEPACAASS